MTPIAVGRGLEDMEQPAMSSLTVGRELEDLDLWLAGLFTAAELAAAELLLQLSVAGAGADDKAAASTSTTPSSSPRWASPCSDNLTNTVEEKQQQEEQVVQETALPLASAELDRRARKRYRRLSELYAATVPVTSASDTAEKKRKMHHDHHWSSSVVEATRYGGHY